MAYYRWSDDFTESMLIEAYKSCYREVLLVSGRVREMPNVCATIADLLTSRLYLPKHGHFASFRSSSLPRSGKMPILMTTARGSSTASLSGFTSTRFFSCHCHPPLIVCSMRKCYHNTYKDAHEGVNIACNLGPSPDSDKFHFPVFGPMAGEDPVEIRAWGELCQSTGPPLNGTLLTAPFRERTQGLSLL